MDNFRTAVAVNDALGRLFALQAQNRIPIRNAMALAYTAQVILSSIDAVREEVVNAEGEDSHRGIIQKAIDAAYGPLKSDDEKAEEENDQEESDQEQQKDEQEDEPENEPENKAQSSAHQNTLDRTIKLLSGS
jgi:hypothetical protein